MIHERNIVTKSHFHQWTLLAFLNFIVLSHVWGAPVKIDAIDPEPGIRIGELLTVELFFNEPVLGVDASDLQVGNSAALEVHEPAQGHFVFTFAEPPEGVVVFKILAGNGIRGLDGEELLPIEWSYHLDREVDASQVRISEFMAFNSRTLRDENGDSSDWIEIQNDGSSIINLSGWALTDEVGVRKWVFPNMDIAAKSYLVVFASGKDRKDPAKGLHTNFRLDLGGEYLGLLRPDGRVASEFGSNYPIQSEDISYGRVPGERDFLGFFNVPSPGKPNVSGGAAFGPPVKFSRLGGNFTTPFQLKLETEEFGATIVYTLDGSMPTNSSKRYTGPITINETVQVRARAYQLGLLPGPPASETFIQLATDLTGFTSNLPLLILHTVTRTSVTEARNTFTQVSIHETINGVSCLTNEPSFSTRGGIKIRGSSTAGLTKSSFAMEWWDEFNQDRKLEVLGMPAESEWVLYAPNQFDPVLIHNPFMHQLSRNTGRYSPRTRFVEVYYNKAGGILTTNHYQGIYVLEEKISIGKDRVDIDELEPEHLQPPEVTGGYLLKVDRLDPADGGFFAGGISMGHVEPKERALRLSQRAPQRKYLLDYFNAFGRSLTATNWLDPVSGYAAYIDVQSWLDYHVLEVISGNVDSLVLSCYLHKPRGGKITYGPHWDFDRALGSTDGRDSNPRQWQTGPFFSATWWSRLFRDIEFWQGWVDTYQGYRSKDLATPAIYRLIDDLAGEVRQAQPRERLKWRTSMRGGSYQGEVNLMKTWLSNRLEFIDRQLAQPPSFNFPNGPVEQGSLLALKTPLLPTNSVIYYTLDGSDPRLPRGDISTNARVYIEPIPITQTTRIHARAWNPRVRQSGGPSLTTPWSVMVTGIFSINAPRLRFSEIMFDAPESGGDGNGEFVEIINLGSSEANLAGMKISGDIEYDFGFGGSSDPKLLLAPKARIVVAKNLQHLQNKHPFLDAALGNFNGRLSGDRPLIRIQGRWGETIWEERITVPSHSLSRGFGFSWVLDEASASSTTAGMPWRTSSYVGGSPSLADPLPIRHPRIWINEVYPGSSDLPEEWIELKNEETVGVDVSGWILRDRFENRSGFKIPQGTSIPGGGYLVVRPNLGQPGNNNSLGLSRNGDEVHLFSATPVGVPTGWHHGLSYRESNPNSSLGLTVTTDHRQHLVPLGEPTPGGLNSEFKAGEILITEIHPLPESTIDSPGDEGQFVEIHNPGDVAVELWHPSMPQLTWRLRGTVDYDFPIGFSLPPRSYVVVRGQPTPVKIDSISARVQQLRHGGEVRTLGPWRGRLQPAGNVRILKPDPKVRVLQAEDMPFITVDSVDYLTDGAWPNIQGHNQSIHRKVPVEFGSEPKAWIPATPTPGDQDSDGDGLTDRWEKSFGLDPQSAAGVDGAEGDPDGDQLKNLAEFVSGSAPIAVDSKRRLHVETDPEGRTWIRFLHQSGKRRVLESAGAIDSSRWLSELDIPSSNPDRDVIFQIAPVGSARYFRVREP